jgi:thiamine biosynthesis lipoprotein
MRELQRMSFPTMGTECYLAVSADASEGAAAHLALAAAWNELCACERILSRFDSRSQLCELNRSAGSWLSVDERLFAALTAAVRLRSETNGRFDPSILPALVAQGYDRSFELLEPRPPLAGCLPAGAAIELDPEECRARIERGASVDLGGIGKGFAAARALDAMLAVWPELPGALVDLGGDVAVVGAPPESGPWLISVESPWRPGRSLGTIRLAAGGVATSGPTRRRFGPDGALHHLIDPATGEPSDSGPLAVTVVARDPVDADAHATALAVSSNAAGYVAAHPELGALVVDGLAPPRPLGAIDFLPRPVSFEVTV